MLLKERVQYEIKKKKKKAHIFPILNGYTKTLQYYVCRYTFFLEILLFIHKYEVLTLVLFRTIPLLTFVC